MRLKDKVAIVTGASSGIGLATARRLAKAGVKVALVARSRGKLEKLAREIPNSWALVADLTKAGDIRGMVEKVKRYCGRIDILVNSAGQGYDAPVEHIALDTFYHIFNLDVVGPLLAMQQVIPLMRRQGGGAIVNVSSGTALMHLPNMAPYSSLKRAIADISLIAREELKKDNIVVSVVYPYMTETDFEKNTIKSKQEVDWGSQDGSPLPPSDTPEYVAKKIVDGVKSGKAEIFVHAWMEKLH